MSESPQPEPSRSALVLGASGLIGGHCLDLLLDEPRYSSVRVVGRRPLSREHPKLDVRVVDFEKLAEQPELFDVDDVFCCLGTTLAKAGSKEGFERVDHHYVAEGARMAAEAGASQFLLVTALGADPSSRVFYNRIKGEAEVAVKKLPFRAVWIVRPSLLRGEREELRLAERAADLASRGLGFVFVGPLRRYRPVEARQVAAALVRLAVEDGTGGVLESEEISALAAAG